MAAAGEQALAARPLVAVLDLRRRLAYWSNITEEHAGWVFKVRLSDAYRGGGWPPEPLSARERRTLAVGPILSHASALHARYTERSDLGTTRPGPADSRSTRWLEAEHELLLVEYEVLGARACQHSLCPALDRPSGPSTCSGHPSPCLGSRGVLSPSRPSDATRRQRRSSIPAQSRRSHCTFYDPGDRPYHELTDTCHDAGTC